MVDIVFDGSVTASSFIGGGGGGTVYSESTGLLTGGVLSTGAAATEYSISDGTGQIVAADGTKTDVSWTGKINITPVALLTANISFVGITAAGAVIESTAAFTNVQQRTIIQLGVAVHVNRVTVDAVNNEQHVSYNTNSQLNDLSSAIGFFNVSGNVITANGANLSIDKSVGDMYGIGVNYGVDIDNPNVLTLALLTAATFQYRFSDGSNGTTGIFIDPDNLDDGSGGLTPLPGNRWSIQRVYSFTSNNLKLQLGQTEYGSKDAAIAGITSGTFVTEPSIAANGLLRGFIVVRSGTTDLTQTNRVAFEILTNSTQGAFTLRRGSAADTDDIYQGQNNAGTKTFSVDGNGLITSTGINLGDETLANYVEGTWTPAFTCATPGDLSVVYTSRSGRYTRIGNTVFVRHQLTCVPTYTTASGQLRFSSLPFASGVAGGDVCGFAIQLAAGFTWGGIPGTQLLAGVGGTSTNATLTAIFSGGGSEMIDIADITGGSGSTIILNFSGTYIIG